MEINVSSPNTVSWKILISDYKMVQNKLPLSRLWFPDKIRCVGNPYIGLKWMLSYKSYILRIRTSKLELSSIANKYHYPKSHICYWYCQCKYVDVHTFHCCAVFKQNMMELIDRKIAVNWHFQFERLAAIFLPCITSWGKNI